MALAQRVPLLPGAEERVYVDIDSLLRPVYGHHKQAARSGTPSASRALLRLGLSPQISGTISTATAAPVIAEARLRSGKAASGRAAAGQIKQAIGTARACGRTGTILVRGDSAFGTKKVNHHLRGRRCCGLSIGSPQQAHQRAIEAIDEAAYTRCTTPAR